MQRFISKANNYKHVCTADPCEQEKTHSWAKITFTIVVKDEHLILNYHFSSSGNMCCNTWPTVIQSFSSSASGISGELSGNHVTDSTALGLRVKIRNKGPGVLDYYFFGFNIKEAFWKCCHTSGSSCQSMFRSPWKPFRVRPKPRLPRWVDVSTISFRPWPYFPKPSPSLKPILAWRKQRRRSF